MDSDESTPLLDDNNGRRIKFRITVEPVAFLFLSASVISSIVNQNLYLRKVCLVNFHLNETECSSPHQNGSSSDEIQRYVSGLSIYASLLENLPNIFFVLFVGPWSDRNGRKIPMMCPLIGQILSVSLYALNYHFQSWPAEYLLLASIPLGLCGGGATVLMTLNSYIADITTDETRTSRISLLYGSIVAAFPVASFASIYIFTYGGYLAIWGTSLALASTNLLYIIFFIAETRRRPDDDAVSQSSCLSVLTNLWRCFAVTFQSRLGHKRASLTILIGSMCLFVFAQVPGNVTYLLARKMFAWDQPQFALFATVASLTTVAGSVLVLPLLSSYLKIDDCLIGMAAVLADIAGSLSIAFARSPTIVFAATSGFVLVGSIGVVIRSMISKLVPSDELSHVFSVLASIESFVPLISSPTYNLVYKASVESFPGCVYALSSGILLILFSLLTTVLILRIKERTNGNDPAAAGLYEPVDPTDSNQSTSLLDCPE